MNGLTVRRGKRVDKRKHAAAMDTKARMHQHMLLLRPFAPCPSGSLLACLPPPQHSLRHRQAQGVQVERSTVRQRPAAKALEPSSPIRASLPSAPLRLPASRFRAALCAVVRVVIWRFLFCRHAFRFAPWQQAAGVCVCVCVLVRPPPCVVRRAPLPAVGSGSGRLLRTRLLAQQTGNTAQAAQTTTGDKEQRTRQCDESSRCCWSCCSRFSGFTEGSQSPHSCAADGAHLSCWFGPESLYPPLRQTSLLHLSSAPPT
jgi:hypothetical protein